MIPCSNCQQMVADDANFCDQCGERVQREPPPVKPLPRFEEPPRFPRALARLLVIAAAATIVALVVVLLRNEGPTTPRPPSGPDLEGDGANIVVPEPPRPSPPPPEQVLQSNGETVVRVTLNCEGCEVALLPADGTEPQRATVVAGAVEFRAPTRSTLGAALSVTHPQGFGHESAYNIAVLSVADREPGDRLTVADVADAPAVGVCWAGTTDSAATIRLAVEAFSNASERGGLRVWSEQALPVLEAPIAPAGDGTVDVPAVAVCAQAHAAQLR